MQGIEENRPTAKSARPLAALLPFVWPYRMQMGLALLFLMLAAAATLSLPIAVRQVIDLGFSQANAEVINTYFWALFAVAVLMAFSSGLRFYWVSWLGERVVADIRDALYRKIISMSPAFFEVTRTGEVLSRLNTDTTLVQTVVGSGASIALRSVVMLLASSVMLFITSAKLALYMALVIPLVLLPILITGRWVRRLSRASQDRIADFSAIASETINAVQTVQAFNQSEREAKSFAAAVETAFATAKRRILARVMLSISVILLVFGAIVLVLWMGARAVLSGDMTGGLLSQFILYSVMAASATGALSEVWGEVQRAAGAMERIAELLAAKPEIAAPAKPLPMPSTGQGRIEFRNVSFNYPARPDTQALKELSFEGRPGETVALVGPSGAGKTTIFQLLLRFYDPTEGEVLIDGVNLTQTDPLWVRQQLALVPQDTVIFSSNALENIRYGNPGVDLAAVQQAARVAHADQFIDALPDGYQTFLGERGVRLSGGQKQRLSIARAVLKDPKILLLDEATSSLDAESERLVQSALEDLQSDRTTLVIAHRLATVRQADRILVLDDGCIVAAGSHRQLLSRSALYARLAKLQFAA